MNADIFMWTLIIILLVIGVISIAIAAAQNGATMTIYINHNDPNAITKLTAELIQTGISNQQLASEVARYILGNRVYTWKGLNFVHYG